MAGNTQYFEPMASDMRVPDIARVALDRMNPLPGFGERVGQQAVCQRECSRWERRSGVERLLR